jgi:hypothetical protein
MTSTHEEVDQKIYVESQTRFWLCSSVLLWTFVRAVDGVKNLEVVEPSLFFGAKFPLLMIFICGCEVNDFCCQFETTSVIYEIHLTLSLSFLFAMVIRQHPSEVFLFFILFPIKSSFGKRQVIDCWCKKVCDKQN